MDWHSFDIQSFRLGRGRVNQAASVLSKRLEIMGTAAGRYAGFCHWTVSPLGRLLPSGSSNLPECSASSVVAFCLVLLRMGFGLLRTVTSRTVRSYRTISPLPVPCCHSHRRLCFLFHFPSPRGARPLAGILLCAARTFLPAQRRGDCLACCDTGGIITDWVGKAT